MQRTIKIIAVVILVCITLWVPAVSQFSKEIRKTVDISNDGRVDIDTYKGSITIQTWDQPMVEIYAQVEADGRAKYDREMVDDTEIRIHSSSDRVEIRSDYGRSEHHGFSLFGLFGEESGSLPFVHYTIKMPATARLKIKDYKSETKISNLLSSLRMETYKGSVIINEHNGPVDIETYKGNVKIDFARLSGDCSFETYKGRVEITLPKNAGFKLRADLGRRSDFTCDFDLNIKRSSRKDDYIKASVNGGGPELSFNTTKGEIRLYEK